MYRLTDRRYAKAKAILEKYRSHVHQHGRFVASMFEKELRDCWNVGYQRLKDIIIDLSKRERYRYLAAYYMEHSGAPGVVVEFQRPLARMYGIRHYRAEDREEKRSEFWAAVPRE